TSDLTTGSRTVGCAFDGGGLRERRARRHKRGGNQRKSETVPHHVPPVLLNDAFQQLDEGEVPVPPVLKVHHFLQTGSNISRPTGVSSSGRSSTSSNSMMLSISVPIAILVTRSRMNSTTTGTL